MTTSHLKTKWAYELCVTPLTLPYSILDKYCSFRVTLLSFSTYVTLWILLLFCFLHAVLLPLLCRFCQTNSVPMYVIWSFLLFLIFTCPLLNLKFLHFLFYCFIILHFFLFFPQSHVLYSIWFLLHFVCWNALLFCLLVFLILTYSCMLWNFTSFHYDLGSCLY